MKIRKINPPLALLLMGVSLTANAFIVDWNKITHWAGRGDNRAALVVQFADDGPRKAYVWGYRWEDASHHPSGEEVFRAIASECDDLYLFTQFTGWMGNTVCGIGYSKDCAVADHIEFDFEAAMADPCISFNWFSANETLGQTSTPGWDTPELCAEAIEDSKTTHILEHPIDARRYGYACYDYDHWGAYATDSSMRWQAGWYEGYWSYWVGGVDSESLAYSGLGYTSRQLSDGSVDAWKFTSLAGGNGDEVDGITGATTPWHELDYHHFDTSGLSEVETASRPAFCKYFRLDGTAVADIASAPAGIYVEVTATSVRKIVKQ